MITFMNTLEKVSTYAVQIYLLVDSALT